MPFVEIIFPSLNRRRFIDDDRSLVLPFEWRQTIVDDLLFGCVTSSVDLFLTDERWVAVEIRVGKPLRSRARVIDDVEPKLPVIIANTSAAPDDLFEFGQRANDAG